MRHVNNKIYIVFSFSICPYPQMTSKINSRKREWSQVWVNWSPWRTWKKWYYTFYTSYDCLKSSFMKPKNLSLQRAAAIPKYLHFTWQSMMTNSVRRDNLNSNIGNKTSSEWNSDLPILALERINPSSSKKRLRQATRKGTLLPGGFNRNNFSLVKPKDCSTFNKYNLATKHRSEETFFRVNRNRKT